MIIENFISPEICGQILAEYEPIAQEVLEGKRSENISKVQLHQGAFRIERAEQFSPTAVAHFFQNELIIQTAKAFVSKAAVSYRQEADYKVKAGEFLQANLPHIDDWRHRFKAFLYLTDVTEDNAPFVYYKGSHKQDRWKRKYHLEFERDGITGRYGHFFLQEMRGLQEKYGFEELVCTGKAGTLIFADFRGIHKGTTLKSGKRILLNNTFGITLDGVF